MNDANTTSNPVRADAESGRTQFFFGLRSKMALSFGIVFAVVLTLVSLTRTFGIPFTSDRGSYGEAREEVFRNLSLVADLKKERLLLWLTERKGDVEVLAENESIASSVQNLGEIVRRDMQEGRSVTVLRKDLAEAGESPALMTHLDLVLRVHKVYRTIQIALADEALIVASTDRNDLGVDVSKNRAFVAAMKVRHKTVLDIQPAASSGQPCLVVSRTIQRQGPARGGDTRPLGVVMMYVSADEFIKPLLYTGGGLGESGEIVLVSQDLRLLVSLKHPLRDGAGAKVLEYRVRTEPARLAAGGNEGIAIAKDYRDVWVLAAYRSIQLSPGKKWGMVVKRDRVELFGPLRMRLFASSLISVLGILGAAALATWIASRISWPIRELSRVAREVESGNFDVRASWIGSDEVGDLGATFNSMIDRVQHWHRELEKEVGDRTADLRAEVAERKRVEKALRSSEQRFDLAVRGSNVGIWDWWDIEGDRAWFSERFLDMLGYERSELGSSLSGFAGLLHPEDSEATREALRAHLEHEVPYDREHRLKTKLGDYRWFRSRGEALRDENGRPIRMAGSLQDITDRKLADAEREKLIAELESKNAELERFTYTVSHDLTSPLITIRTFAGFIEQEVSRGAFDNIGSDLQRIVKAAETMAQLLDELLELSRIGRLVNPTTEVSLAELAQEARELLAAAIGKREVDVHISSELPRVLGDRARLLEVFQNLLENAVKFMGDQPRPRVEIGVRPADHEHVVYIRDNGIGVEPRYHERIFGLFDKLDKSYSGTGIGLALVKRIVEVHGGRLWVESEGSGRGSTFFFTLPRGKPHIGTEDGSEHDG